MKHVKKSVLLWYSASEMYALVTNVADYPAFLPWCERAEVIASDDAGMTARLHLHYAGVRHAFTTRNQHVRDRSVRAIANTDLSLLFDLYDDRFFAGRLRRLIDDRGAASLTFRVAPRLTRAGGKTADG